MACCDLRKHEMLKCSIEVFVRSTRNLREQEETGDPRIRLLLGDCRDCRSTIGLELGSGERLHTERCPACARLGNWTDDSGKITPHHDAKGMPCSGQERSR